MLLLLLVVFPLHCTVIFCHISVPQFVHASVSYRTLGLFTLLAIMNKAINIYVQVLNKHKLPFPLHRYLDVGLLGHTANAHLTLQKTINDLKVAVPFCIPTNNGSEFQLLHILASTW